MAASGGGVPQLGGHDYEFVCEVPDKWMCLICQLALKEPVQIVGCGHRLCKICMDEVMRRPQPTCPADRTPITRDKLFPDAGCEREIQDLHVKCPNEDCSWTGELRAVKAHEVDCPEGQVPCYNAGCKEKIKRKDGVAHMFNTCEWRIIECEHCQDNLPFCQLWSHLDAMCKRYPLPCENKCSAASIPREEMQHHLTAACPLTVVSCKYKHLGCQDMFPRTQTDDHLNSNLRRHLDLACLMLEEQDKRNEEQERRFEQQERRIAEQEEKMAEQGRAIGEAVKTIEILQQRFALKRSNTIYRGELGLTIDKRLTKGAVVSSNPFYLGGYKMKLLARFVWWADRRPSVLVGIGITVGKFDQELEWPFKSKISVSFKIQPSIFSRLPAYLSHLGAARTAEPLLLQCAIKRPSADHDNETDLVESGYQPRDLSYSGEFAVELLNGEI